MKDEEFQKKLEIILERFEKIDYEIKKELGRERHTEKHVYHVNESYSRRTLIPDDKYKKKSYNT